MNGIVDTPALKKEIRMTVSIRLQTDKLVIACITNEPEKDLTPREIYASGIVV
jgi:hypothetical protein